MKRFAYLIPAIVGATGVSMAIALLDLGSNASYICIGLVGFVVLTSGIIRDIRSLPEDPDVVHLHKAAIRAEEHYCPEALGHLRVRRLFDAFHGDDLSSSEPLLVAARRARPDAPGLKRVKKRIKVKRVKIDFSHRIEPTLRQRV